MKLLIAHAPPLLVAELARRDVDVVALHYPWFRPDDATLGHLRAAEPFDMRSKLDLRAISRMRHLIVAHRPDVVHAFSPKSLAAVVIATRGMRRPPAIASFRGISTPPSRMDPANHITFLSRHVRVHACESNAVAHGLVSAGISQDACHTIYNCVGLPQPLSVAARADLRTRLGIPADAFVVGTIAQIRPVKGTDLLLRAGLECGDLADVRWLVIGGGRDPRVDRLAADPRWEGRLRMAGRIDGADGLAGAFDLFVMPSRHEGLCRALLEAMSWGVCPIVSDAGGMKEMVRHGIDGIVVPREDAPAIARAVRLLHLNRDRAAAFGASARRRIAEICTPEAFADRVLAMHAQAVA